MTWCNGRKKAITKWHIDQIRELSQEGLTPELIARRIQISSDTVCDLADKHEIILRHSNGARETYAVRQIMSDSGIAELYAGQRYENRTGIEISSAMPSRAIRGACGSAAALCVEAR